MAVLHDALMKLVGEVYSDASVKSQVVRRVSAKKGISLSEPQLLAILKAIDEGSGSDCVVADLDGLDRPLSINPEDLEQALLELLESVDKRFEDAVQDVMAKAAPTMLESLYATLPHALKERRLQQRRFESGLYRRWQDALDRLEMVIMLAHEAGGIYLEDVRRDLAGQAVSDESVLLDVLVAIHCRACRTAREILCLLKAGYADGANARWRSLHELAVTALFLLQHRGDTPRRFLDHIAIERCRAAKEHQTHCHTLGYEPFSAAELLELEKASDDVIVKYGRGFRKDYGWAAHLLPGPGRPSFAQIEANLDMSHWRPFFRLACGNVHAGPQGLFFSMGILDASDATFLAAASNAGLADPGHQTAISLTQATIALLTPRPNLDGLVACKCILMVCHDVGLAFSQAHEKLAQDANLASEPE